MYQYIIIKDLKNKTENIYNFEAVDYTEIEAEILLCVNDLQKLHASQILQYKKINNTNLIKIYYESVFTNKGYLWSTTQRTTEQLYELRIVNLFKLPSEYQSSSDNDMSSEKEDTESAGRSSFFTLGTGYANNLFSPFLNQNLKMYQTDKKNEDE
jgi:hypothetical protein